MRRLSGVAGWAVGGWAAAAALFHIWTAYAGAWEPREMRAIHLLFLIPLAFVLFPAGKRSPEHRVPLADWAWAALSAVPCLYVIRYAQELTERWEGVHPVSTGQVILGTILVVAVLSSGLYGTISGSSVADCYATGTFTIPLMKKIGYKPEIAAGIEATASCGGPLMPPIMGAGAFIMAELTGVPYQKIIVAAALPAILYYLSIMATVHWEALKHGIGTMKAEMPPLSSLLRRALLFSP